MVHHGFLRRRRHPFAFYRFDYRSQLGRPGGRQPRDGLDRVVLRVLLLELDHPCVGQCVSSPAMLVP